jgi:hypothetical protein
LSKDLNILNFSDRSLRDRGIYDSSVITQVKKIKEVIKIPYDIIVGRDEADKKIFGKKGLILLGKSYVKMEQYTSLSNPIYLDVARSHVILVSGKRGSGKCLHEDTLITLSDGSQISIKDLENNNENILSLNEKLKIQEAKKTEFFSREVDKLIKIKLRSGKEIKLTPEHPLLTIKGWTPTQDLRIGSRIATPRKSFFGKENMPEHEIKLLAYLIAEGHTRKVVLFSNSDEKIVKEFRDSLYKLDPTLELIKEKENHYRISSPNWQNKVLIASEKRDKFGHFIKGERNFYEKRSIRKVIEKEGLFNKLSKEKVLSNKIMSLKKESLVLFLNRLFSCDGSLYCKKSNAGKTWQISYASSSEKMIRQVQNLLLKFEILSKLRERIMKLNGKEFKSFELILNAENVLKFIEEIGFFGKKQEREFEAKQHILSVERNSNIDTIPIEIWETYEPKNWAKIGRAFGYKHPKAIRERINYSPSRQTLLKIAEIENYNPLYLLATSDIFWDEIVSMEILDGKFKVYDISVPENHNFVANDIIVHNSYTLGTIAEELSLLPKEEKANIASLVFDTMGIFWTMKYENEKDRELLEEWGLKPQKIDARVFVPYGYFEDYEKREIPTDYKFALNPAELNAEDWIITFGLQIIDSISILIERMITKLKEEREIFYIQDIISEIEKSSSDEKIKTAAIGLFEAAASWKVFADGKQEATSTFQLIKAGETSVLDLSMYSSTAAFNIRALVISLICRKLFNERMLARKKEEVLAIQHGQDYLSFKQEREMPLVWLFIDEIHEFLPAEGKTPATDSLIQLLREGRQPGISLVMATQQPGALARDAITQADIIISHRVTAAPDIKALNEIMQSYLLESINRYMDDLPSLKGSAILLDDNSERIYPFRTHPRYTWHGGEAPTSIKIERRL